MDTLIRVLSGRPKRSNFLSDRIAEALLQSGSANARQAVEEWRKSQA